MFTGIITDVGTVRSIDEESGCRRIVLATAYETSEIPIGASIACAGACLTVVGIADGEFFVDVSNETLACTTLGDWRSGIKVNLERALRVGDELGGHIVTGHVDAVATVKEAEPDGDNIRLVIAPPGRLMPFIAEKGSIAVDGVSLTVNAVGKAEFAVNIIPHTVRHTTLGECREGTRVNMEIDLLARYVARLGSAA